MTKIEKSQISLEDKVSKINGLQLCRLPIHTGVPLVPNPETLSTIYFLFFGHFFIRRVNSHADKFLTLDRVPKYF